MRERAIIDRGPDSRNAILRERLFCHAFVLVFIVISYVDLAIVKIKVFPEIIYFFSLIIEPQIRRIKLHNFMPVAHLLLV